MVAATANTQALGDETKDDEELRRKLQPFIDMKKKRTADEKTDSKDRQSTKSKSNKSKKSVKTHYVKSNKSSAYLFLRDVIDSASQKLRALSNKTQKTQSPAQISSTSSKKRKKQMAIRIKGSKKKPVDDLNSIFIDLAGQRHGQMTAEAMEYRRKQRLRRESRMESICIYVTALILLLSAILGTIGWMKCFLSHWQLSALEAAEQEKAQVWKNDCGRQTIYRMIHGKKDELQCEAEEPMDKARWAAWTRCSGGKQYRWRILKANVSYLTRNTTTFEERTCQTNESTSFPLTTTSSITTTNETPTTQKTTVEVTTAEETTATSEDPTTAETTTTATP